MRIKEVEELVGITKKNIRFYEKEGLLTPQRELENSYRDYSEEDIRRLRVIKLLRKLDMPISAIGDVLEERLPLQEAVHLHGLLLEEQRRSILSAQQVCRNMEADAVTLAALEPEAYLAEIVHGEAQGKELVDLKKQDSVGTVQYRELLLVAVILGAILLITASVLIWLSIGTERTFWYFAAIPVVVLAGLIRAVITRLKEIKGGEEDDLTHY